MRIRRTFHDSAGVLSLSRRTNGKLGNALKTLAWIKHYDTSILEGSLLIVRSHSIHDVYKDSALRALARHADSVGLLFIRKLMRALARASCSILPDVAHSRPTVFGPQNSIRNPACGFTGSVATQSQEKMDVWDINH